MKMPPLRTLVLAGTTVMLMAANSPIASASTPQNYSGVRVENAPPHDLPDPRWEAPAHDAIWIAGHYDWIHGRWAWVGGYYAYPPHLGAVWVAAHYSYGRYFVGHWAR